MTPRISSPDSRIDAIRGCVAIERGPEVYALESVDLAPAGAADVADVVLAPGTRPSERDGRVWIDVVPVGAEESAPAWPYAGGAAAPGGAASVSVPLVPYHEWAERGPSTMRVWIPVAS